MKRGILILILFSSVLCQAQSDSIFNIAKGHKNLILAYNSSLIFPGISAGIEFPVRSCNVLTNPSFTKSGFLRGKLNYYHHPDFHDNLYLTVEWLIRKLKSNGYFSEFSFGPGLSRTFIGGTTYRVNEIGNVSIVKMAGYYYALITAGGGFGYDFNVKRKFPLSIFGRMNIIAMFPYNSIIYLRPVLEIGVFYTLSGGK